MRKLDRQGLQDRFHGGLDGTARLQDFDGEGFEEEDETAVLSSPWRHDRVPSVLRTATSRQPGDQLRRELHRVEVPPTPLFCVIGRAARLAAFRTGNTHTPNFFTDLPADLPEELFTTLLHAPRVRIERIVSLGHQSPDGFWC